jgi:hypothetical protein
MDGHASVLHDYHWEDYGYPYYCGYHETHEYAKELVATIQTKFFFGEQPYQDD